MEKCNQVKISEPFFYKYTHCNSVPLIVTIVYTHNALGRPRQPTRGDEEYDEGWAHLKLIVSRNLTKCVRPLHTLVLRTLTLYIFLIQYDILLQHSSCKLSCCWPCEHTEIINAISKSLLSNIVSVFDKLQETMQF